MNTRKLSRHWRIKGLLQGAFSLVPGGVGVNDWLQDHMGGLSHFEQNLNSKLYDWGLMMSYFRAAGVESIEGWDILEIGTGWYPVLPICFALAGVRSICGVDLNQHLNEALTLKMVASLEAHLDEIAEHSRCPVQQVRERWSRLAGVRNLTDLLSVANIDYRAPQDATRLHWIADGALHLVYSNSVFEHVSASVIPELFRESRRVLREDGLVAHEVACNDHYADFDKSISYVNYLQYPDWHWRLWNNQIQYQNRMRAPDFIRLAEESGFRIVYEARNVKPGTREGLARIRIAPQFKHYNAEDLVATTVDFVAAKT
jgi:hypothetical protein